MPATPSRSAWGCGVGETAAGRSIRSIRGRERGGRMALLDGHRAVVTGGASGIGAQTARRMTDEGARVAILDANGDGAEMLAKELDGLAYRVDVTDYAAVQAAVDDAHAQLGGLSLLYN